jgi:signal transduction histidine kinase/CRP-like cAMP-binding protein
MSTNSIVSRIRDNILFAGVDEAVIRELTSSITEVAFAAGEVIFVDASIGEGLYLLESGRVKLTKATKEGNEIVLGVLHPNDFFGEMQMIDGVPRSAHAVAIEPSVVAIINEAAFQKLLREQYLVSSNVMRALSTRLRAIDETLVFELANTEMLARTKLDKLHLLIDATKNVNSSLNLDKLLGIILENATNSIQADRGTLYLVDEMKGELWSKVAQGKDMVEIRLPMGKGLAGVVAKTGEIINIPDAYADQRFNPEIDKKTGYRTHNILTMPMKNRSNRIIGVFQLLNKHGGPFTQEDEDFIDALSAGASIAIENARLAQEMVQSERLSSVGRMASAIIHDIKNPMNTIRVYAQVMKKKSGNEEAVKLADEMIRQVDRLVNMLQEILDFSRGVSATNIIEVNLGETLDAILVFIEKDLNKHNIQLEKQLNYTGPCMMDADKMTRAFYNIASNARDAMPTGGLLTVTTLEVNGLVRISFRDTGTGMPEEVRKRIFEPFMTYGKKHGTGLGMAIVKKVIDDHDGQIEIESELGKGTEMIIYLPQK